MGAGSFNGNSEEAGVREVGVSGANSINERVGLGEIDGSSSAVSVGGVSDQLSHDVVSWDIIGGPWARLESKSNASGWGLGPLSQFSSNILRSLSLEVVLWGWQQLTESLLDEINVFLMVLNSAGNNKAFTWGDIVHDEVLKKSGIDIVNILGDSKSWHTESVVSVGGSQQHLTRVSEWVEFGQVIIEIVRLGILGSSDIAGHDGLWLEGAVDHHLEHIGDIVLNAVSLEVSLLLIVVHGHSSTGHLDHTIVEGLVSVLLSLQVGILDAEKGSRSFVSLISGSNIHHNSHMDSAWEALALGKDGEAIGQISDAVLSWHISGLLWGVIL